MKGFVYLLLCVALLLTCQAYADENDMEVRIGVYENSPLLSFGAGKPSGLFVDIVRHVAAAEGWVPSFVAGTFDQNLMRLDGGEIDLLPAIAVTDAR